MENIAERLLWRGSKEDVEVQRLQDKKGGNRREIGHVKAQGGRVGEKRNYRTEGLRGGFWNGGEEGAREVGRVGKSD